MPACNLWAIGKTIEAMRGIDRWGCSDLLNRAFTGFSALPEKAGEANGAAWYQILNIDPKSEIATIKKAFKNLAKKYHPDKIGENDYFLVVQKAYETGLSLKSK